MQIRPTVTQINFRGSTPRNTKPATIPPKQESKGLSSMEKVGIGLFSVIALGVIATLGRVAVKKPPRISFEKILNKNGLELKNNFLVKKGTGEKFTGELKRSTRESNIETQKFANGVITEKIYTDWRGNEIKGYFYKNGELKLDVSCVTGKGRRPFCFHDYENGEIITLGDGLIEKDESVFEWAREKVK